MIESILAKATAGLSFRIGSVVTLAGSALLALVIVAGFGHIPPSTLLSQVARWLGLDWDLQMNQAHEWLAQREPIVLQAAIVVGALALLIALYTVGKLGSAVVDNLRWVTTVTVCAAIWTELDGSGSLLWWLAAIVGVGLVAAIHSRHAAPLGFVMMTPLVLLLFPVFALTSFLGPSLSAGQNRD